VITDLTTKHWTWTLVVALAMLALAVAGFTWWDRVHAPASNRTRVTMRATRGGRLVKGRIRARDNATVEQTARKGSIDDADIDARNADVDQRVNGGKIDDTRVDAFE
jgi:hypothetical protein